MSSNGSFLKGDGLEVSFNGSRLQAQTVSKCFGRVNFCNANLTQRKGRDRAANESAGL